MRRTQEEEDDDEGDDDERERPNRGRRGRRGRESREACRVDRGTQNGLKIERKRESERSAGRRCVGEWEEKLKKKRK
jgi:hypothetical protein